MLSNFAALFFRSATMSNRQATERKKVSETKGEKRTKTDGRVIKYFLGIVCFG